MVVRANFCQRFFKKKKIENKGKKIKTGEFHQRKQALLDLQSVS